MIWTPYLDWRVRAAAAFVAAAILVAAREVRYAFRADAVAATAPLVTRQAPAPAAASAEVEFERLAELAPFGASRAEPSRPLADGATTYVPITLVGTIAGADQPAAICRLGGAAARILHVGDTLGGWRLQQVAPGRALFIDAAAQRHELRIHPPGN